MAPLRRPPSLLFLLPLLLLLLPLAQLSGATADSGPCAGPVSPFAGLADEAAALQVAEAIELSSLSPADFTCLIRERRWLTATHVLLKRVQTSSHDFSAPVRGAVTAVRKELDDLIRVLDKSYGKASQISPAFQWAQNSSHVFLQVKFAQRWNAPGALEVEDTRVAVSDCCFSFKGVGEHSMIRKEYKLMLQFLEPVLEAGSAWHFAAAGRLTVTIQKARARKWERLLRSENVQPENMGVWQDMQAKWKAELASMEGAKKASKDRSAGDDDEDDDSNEDMPECEAGAFHGSKVVELCPKAFFAGKPRPWSVLFYSTAGGASQKSQALSRTWRALAEMVTAHNKDAAVGALDCSRHAALCEKKGAKARSLPRLLRYAAGSTANGAEFSGEPNLEDLVAWAAGVQREEL
eukprot:NODE_9701_length_1404_cov_8.700861.p1 GENE.NODE_9701_length_1404_cov_8.700861~~NODE_9701_length_1404_cov_8.700861.p1  ORF type:complete len:407 (-),score=125.53 NODE_9701_length_1404_cov_8.700861:154-1374(-)